MELVKLGGVTINLEGIAYIEELHGSFSIQGRTKNGRYLLVKYSGGASIAFDGDAAEAVRTIFHKRAKIFIPTPLDKQLTPDLIDESWRKDLPPSTGSESGQ